MRHQMKVPQLIILLIFFVGFMSFNQEQPDKKQLERGKKLSKMCTNCHGTTKKVTAFPTQKIGNTEVRNGRIE